MIEPVELKDFFTVFFASALVIIAGAGYAAIFAWSKLTHRPGLLAWAFACYALLAAAIFLLAQAAHFHGPWRILIGLMLTGYLFAPLGIWKLCAATHSDEHSNPSTLKRQP